VACTVWEVWETWELWYAWWIIESGRGSLLKEVNSLKPQAAENDVVSPIENYCKLSFICNKHHYKQKQTLFEKSGKSEFRNQSKQK
jgi:hypothetical protein